jgi:hypothetical protein
LQSSIVTEPNANNDLTLFNIQSSRINFNLDSSISIFKSEFFNQNKQVLLIY